MDVFEKSVPLWLCLIFTARHCTGFHFPHNSRRDISCEIWKVEVKQMTSPQYAQKLGVTKPQLAMSLTCFLICWITLIFFNSDAWHMFSSNRKRLSFSWRTLYLWIWSLFLFIHLFIGAYIAWAISPLCPPTPFLCASPFLTSRRIWNLQVRLNLKYNHKKINIFK
jgi:hypothetical protein